MTHTVLLIILGLTGLWIGTKWIIKSAIGISERYKLSHSFVGIAILAVGTDLPEVFVSIKASLLNLNGIESSGIITGNAIGSSISQITLILGVAGLFLTFTLEKKEWLRDTVALLASIVLLFFFGSDGLISRTEGVCMLVLYVVYYVVLVKSHKNSPDKSEESKEMLSKKMLTFYMLAGFVFLILGSHLVVDNAMQLANYWDVAQSFVGIVIVGVGTSLPELAVSIGAALKKSAGLSVGNVIGSNIFDGLIPIGLGGSIATTKFESNLLHVDLPFLFFSTLLVLIFLRTKRGVSTLEATVLIILFLAYLSYKIVLS